MVELASDSKWNQVNTAKAVNAFNKERRLSG